MSDSNINLYYETNGSVPYVKTQRLLWFIRRVY